MNARAVFSASAILTRSANTDAETKEIPQVKKSSGTVIETVRNEIPEKASGKDNGTTVSAMTEKGGLTLDQLMKADLGMLSDEDLEKGIKVAADAEEYKLASRLRDELKGRKDGGSNG